MFKKSNRKKIIGEFCHFFKENCKIGTKISDNEYECDICMENIDKADLFTCKICNDKHFHAYCIWETIQQVGLSSCPTCMTPYDEETLQEIKDFFVKGIKKILEKRDFTDTLKNYLEKKYINHLQLKIDRKSVFQYLLESIVRRVIRENRLDLLEKNYEYVQVRDDDIEDEINKIKRKAVEEAATLDDYDYYALKFALKVKSERVKEIIEEMKGNNKLNNYTYKVLNFLVSEIESDMLVERMKSSNDNDAEIKEVQVSSLARHIGNILKLRRGPKELDNLLKRKKHVWKKKSLNLLLNRVKIDGLTIIGYIETLMVARARKKGRVRLFSDNDMGINITLAKEYLKVLTEHGLKLVNSHVRRLQNKIKRLR